MNRYSAIFLCFLAACATAPEQVDPNGEAPSGAPSQEPEGALNSAEPEIERDDANRCFITDKAPVRVIIETETLEIRPGNYQNIQRQRILQDETPRKFETVCPEALTRERVTTLQRALQTRGYYPGAIHGELDEATRQAIQSFQRHAYVDSRFLSLRAAQDLGVIPAIQAPPPVESRTD